MAMWGERGGLVVRCEWDVTVQLLWACKYGWRKISAHKELAMKLEGPKGREVFGRHNIQH